MKKAAKDKGTEESEKGHKKKMEEVAKYLRFNVSCKNAVIRGQKVDYFVGSKAVDCLMASKWTSKPPEEDEYSPYFVTRSDAVKYCVTLLKNDFFIRANKVEVKPKTDTKEEAAERKGRGQDSKPTKRKEGKITDSPRAKKQDKEQLGEEGKKKKRKFRLETHQQQFFLDSDDVYYWQYDPPSSSTYFIGFAVVLGAIAVTLQPLWPDSTRVGVWYLSMGLFIIVGLLLVVIVVRWFMYGLVIVFTMGKVQFWILPNLENDKCGFFASFLPLYSIERHVKKSSKKKKVSDDSSKTKESGSEKAKEKEKESDPSASDHEDEGDSEEQEINTEASS